MGNGGALLLVDLQNDFCQGGSLAVPLGDSIITLINKAIEHATALGMPVLASRDWHPAISKHFKESSGLWPSHCIQGHRETQGKIYFQHLTQRNQGVYCIFLFFL